VGTSIPAFSAFRRFYEKAAEATSLLQQKEEPAIFDGPYKGMQSGERTKKRKKGEREKREKENRKKKEEGRKKGNK